MTIFITLRKYIPLLLEPTLKPTQILNLKFGINGRILTGPLVMV